MQHHWTLVVFSYAGPTQRALTVKTFYLYYASTFKVDEVEIKGKHLIITLIMALIPGSWLRK